MFSEKMENDNANIHPNVKSEDWFNINRLEGNDNWEVGEILHDENENAEYDDPIDDDVYDLERMTKQQ